MTTTVRAADSRSTASIAPVGVIGGSGLYRLLDPQSSQKLSVATPYGSADVTRGEWAGRTVVFLTRHGAGHSIAPHLIDYRSNIWALASLGVKAIVSTSAVGGLNPDFAPGTVVIPDQYIDRTTGRADTFYDSDSVQHLVSADPFCPALRAITLDALAASGESVQPTGTVVVISGPRFSTRAESRWFRAAGADIVNMTLYPEVPLAAELGIGTVNLSFVTDTDSGDEPASGSAIGAAGTGSTAESDQVNAELVFARLADAQPRIVAALETIIRALPEDYSFSGSIPEPAIAAVLDRPLRAGSPS